MRLYFDFHRISDSDFALLNEVVEALPEVKLICIDVANGYSQFFVEYVKKVRAKLPHHTIIVSTICFIFKLYNVIIWRLQLHWSQ